MSYQKLLQQMIGVTLVMLPLVGCGAPVAMPTPDRVATGVAEAEAIAATLTAEAPTTTPTAIATDTPVPTETPTPVPPTATPTPAPHVEGSLLNKDTGEPLAGARVILCPKGTEETACVIDADLTSVTDSDGQFKITDVLPGEYVVLYNASGEIRPEWDGMELEYSPVSTFSDPAPTNINHLMRSLGVSSLSTCEAYYEVVDGNLVVSGYLYADSADLAFIFFNGDLVYVTVQDGSGRIALRVWDTENEGGCKGEFDPLR